MTDRITAKIAGGCVPVLGFVYLESGQRCGARFNHWPQYKYEQYFIIRCPSTGRALRSIFRYVYEKVESQVIAHTSVSWIRCVGVIRTGINNL